MEKKVEKKKTFTYFVISDVIYALFLIIWFFMTVMSLVIYSIPADTRLMIIFYTILAYPVALVISAVMSWVLFRRRRMVGAHIWNLVPLLWLLPMAYVYSSS